MTTATIKRNRIMIRACPRCRGDLFPDVEEKNTFTCLQCGRSVDVAQLRGKQAALTPAA